MNTSATVSWEFFLTWGKAIADFSPNSAVMALSKHALP